MHETFDPGAQSLDQCEDWNPSDSMDPVNGPKRIATWHQANENIYRRLALETANAISRFDKEIS